MECAQAIEFFKLNDDTFKIVHQKLQHIKEAVNLLQIPFEVTKLLQRRDCTLSDFYGACIKMREKFKIAAQKDMKTNLAKQLLAEFEKRNGQLMKNEAMLSAVFLDRRFSVDLSERETELAKIALSNTWERYCKLQRSLNKEDEPQPMPNEDECVADVSDEFDFDMTSYLKSKAGEMIGESEINDGITTGVVCHTLKIQPNCQISKSEFLILLNVFEEKFKLIDRKTGILDFWKSQKHSSPELYAISLILNSIPPSQATVEQAFSTLNYIFGSLRSNLSDQLLSDIMLIKLNSEFLYDFFSQEQSDLKKQYSSYNLLDDELN